MIKDIKIGIIGTVGRENDAIRLNGQKWNEMKKVVIEIIEGSIFKLYNYYSVTLVSGGAAYSDFLAVYYYLNGYAENLILHLPCEFDRQFTGGKTAETANWYHYLFSKKITKMEGKSLMLIKKAIDKGAKVTVSDGFFARNTLVAQDSDYLIALTFGDEAKLKDGGTADTMRKFIKLKGDKNSFHVDLNTMEIYNPAKI